MKSRLQRGVRYLLLVTACAYWTGPVPFACSGVTNYVSSGSGSDANGGDHWTNAWATLAYAVAQSSPDDTILLSNGVYTLSTQLIIDKKLTVTGFGADPRDVTIQPESARVDMIRLNQAEAVVENVTVRNGLRGFYLNGGGTVRRCVIYGHSGNRSVSGGVFLNAGGLVDSCIISNNVSGDLGGGAHLNAGGTLRSCLITGNTAASGNNQVGGIFFAGSGGLVENCTILRNHSPVIAGGVYVSAGVGALRNSIVMYNTGPYGNRSGSVSVDNATILAPSYTNVGTTRDVDPQFMDYTNGDYRLRPGSPAIDTGVYQSWMDTARDVAGHPRRDGTVDVGAYEFTRGALAAGFHPSSRSGFLPAASIVFTGAAEGTNTAGLTYVWDFDNDGTNDLTGLGRAVVTNVYTTAGYKTVRLRLTNEVSETAEYTFSQAVKIGPRYTYAAHSTNNATYPYGAWAAASSNVLDAVAAAVDGSTIYVGGGTYLLDGTIVLHEAMVLEGVAGAALTILDGRAARTCIAMNHPNALVDGFTIRNGYGASGGVRIEYGGTLRRCIVTGNVNVASDITGTGGIRAAGPDCFVEYCVIAGNRGGRYGIGGASVMACTFRNCLVYGNWTDGGSGNGTGGMTVSRGGTVESCTVVWNYSPNNTGVGGVMGGSGGGVLRNSIVYFNKGENGALNDAGGTFYAQSVGNVAGSLISGMAGKTDNPLFIRDGTNYSASHVRGDYRLQSTSPAVNNGSLQVWMEGATDLAGHYRVVRGAVDSGAYEWQLPAGTVLIVQ